ncbi:MAG TPA: septum formation initiator family protein [Longimicrobiales bacterium]|nr:septum formation initiator family protein [Longimicrobiales bacterium]
MERLKRLVFPTLVGLAAYYAVFGGEYSLFDLRRIRAARGAEAAALQDLQAEVDSLTLRADSLEHDPAVLERLAREKYGMVRDGEVLYRFVEPGDSGAGTTAEGRR